MLYRLEPSKSKSNTSPETPDNEIGGHNIFVSRAAAYQAAQALLVVEGKSYEIKECYRNPHDDEIEKQNLDPSLVTKIMASVSLDQFRKMIEQHGTKLASFAALEMCGQHGPEKNPETAVIALRAMALGEWPVADRVLCMLIIYFYNEWAATSFFINFDPLHIYRYLPKKIKPLMKELYLAQLK